MCLETAALVARAVDAQADVVDILGAAADLRARGNRPASPTLRSEVDDLRAALGLTEVGGRGPLDRARIDRVAFSALDLLSALG